MSMLEEWCNNMLYEKGCQDKDGPGSLRLQAGKNSKLGLPTLTGVIRMRELARMRPSYEKI